VIDQTIQVSAPGKLMLLGEHAVVHHRACLVTATDSRLHMTLTPAEPGDTTVMMHAPDVNVRYAQRALTDIFADNQPLNKGTRFIESALAQFRDRFGLHQGLRIETRNDFAATKGLGSSSATVACTLFGLSQLSKIPLSQRDLFDIGLEAVLNVQQTGSGFDLAAAIYGGTLYYENRVLRRIEPLNVPNLPLVIAYTGVKADTPTYVRNVARRLTDWPAAMTGIFDAMNQLVQDGRAAIEARNWAQLGTLMDIQHGLAHALGVDTLETVKLVFAARQAGAFGAKLSGAGGGDCIIVLASDDQRPQIETAIEAAGGDIVRIACNAPGVRLDTGED
jgi:mevalonate kinase